MRNIGTIEGNRPASDNDWECVKRGGGDFNQKVILGWSLVRYFFNLILQIADFKLFLILLNYEKMIIDVGGTGRIKDRGIQTHRSDHQHFDAGLPYGHQPNPAHTMYGHPVEYSAQT